jgi:hypothetical protein
MHKAMAAVDKALLAEIMCGFSNERKYGANVREESAARLPAGGWGQNHRPAD